MRHVRVIIPSLMKPHAQNAFNSLKHLPFDYTLDVVTKGDTWPKAINIGLRDTPDDCDVLLMDDDVILQKDTFKDFQTYYDKADIFGFKLLFGDGTIQHGGGIYKGEGCITHRFHNQYNRPLVSAYVCHVTASLMYIKREVLDAQPRMEHFSGQQFEDVDYNWRALKNGFRILFLPNEALHLESGTKQNMPEFHNKMAVSLQELITKHLVHDTSFEHRIEREYPLEIQPI